MEYHFPFHHGFPLMILSFASPCILQFTVRLYSSSVEYRSSTNDIPSQTGPPEKPRNLDGVISDWMFQKAFLLTTCPESCAGIVSFPLSCKLVPVFHSLVTSTSPVTICVTPTFPVNCLKFSVLVVFWTSTSICFPNLVSDTGWTPKTVLPLAWMVRWMEDTKIESWAWEERLTPILTWLPGVFVDLYVIERWMKLLFGSGNLNSGFWSWKGGNARPGLGVNTPLCFITLLACDTSSLRCASWKFDERGEKRRCARDTSLCTYLNSV